MINGAPFNTTFPATKTNSDLVALIVAIYDVGCFAGAVANSFFGEPLGRRRAIFLGVIIMIIGALLQATSYQVAQLIVARIVSGIGMGFINSTVPVMMAEFAPKATRGVFVCAQLSTLNFGIMLVYWIDYAFGTVSGAPSAAWRVPVILQCIFLLPMLLIIMIIPETPRWLVAQGRQEEALEVLQRVNSGRMTEQDVVLIHADIVNTVAYESSINSGKWSDLLRNDEIQSQRRFLIACAVQAFQQLGGINALIYYSNTL